MLSEELVPGLRSWTAPHPDWEPAQGWDQDVRCFYVEADETTLLIDPLVPDDDPDQLWVPLDREVERRGLPVAVLLTQAAHARSAGELADHFGAAVWGHEAAREKVGGAPFHVIGHGDDTPGGSHVLDFAERPHGSGTPLYLTSHRAVAVGDVFISVERQLRVWWSSGDEDDERWYRERYVPSLRAWLSLPIKRILIAHGDEISGGSEEIASALERPPYPHT